MICKVAKNGGGYLSIRDSEYSNEINGIVCKERQVSKLSKFLEVMWY